MIDPIERKTCEECGAEFSRGRSHVNFKARRYCQRSCAHAAMIRSRKQTWGKGADPSQRKTCESCGVEFGPSTWDYGALWGRRRYCTIRCSAVVNSAIRVANLNDPAVVGARSLLARTCLKCGVFLQASDFDSSSSDGGHVRNCRSCCLKRFRALNEATRGRSKHGYQWTGPELEIASRSDLSVNEAAEMLGRSLAAVANARARVRHDPKTTQVVGLARSAQLQSERRTA